MRRVVAGLVSAGTLAGAGWLYMHREWQLWQWIDPTGHQLHTPERVAVQPGWSTPAAVMLLVAAIAVVAWLLPELRLWQRWVDRFVPKPPSPPEPRRRAATPAPAQRRYLPA
jgi:hypothetical protein